MIDTITNSQKRGRGRPKGSKNKNNVSNRCCAIIKHNVRCSKQKLPGEEFCGHHIKKNRCMAYNKYNVQCLKTKLEGKCFCKYHLNNHERFGYIKQNCEENSSEDSDNNSNDSDSDEDNDSCSDYDDDFDSKDITKDINNKELWDIEEDYMNVVINNQIWRFYPNVEKWVKCNNNYEELQDFFEEI